MANPLKHRLIKGIADHDHVWASRIAVAAVLRADYTSSRELNAFSTLAKSLLNDITLKDANVLSITKVAAGEIRQSAITRQHSFLEYVKWIWNYKTRR